MAEVAADTGAGVGDLDDGAGDGDATGSQQLQAREEKFATSRVNVASDEDEREPPVTEARKSALKRADSKMGGMKRALTFQDAIEDAPSPAKGTQITQGSKSEASQRVRPFQGFFSGGEREEERQDNAEENGEERNQDRRKRGGFFGGILDFMAGPPGSPRSAEEKQQLREEHKQRFSRTTVIDEEDRDRHALHEDEEARRAEMIAKKAVAVKGGRIGENMLQHMHVTQISPEKLAAGEAAFVANRQALRMVRAGRLQAMNLGGRKISPIAKNFAKIKAQIEAEAAADARKATTFLGASSGLADWFDSGLVRIKGNFENAGRVEGRKKLPHGFEYASWSGRSVPMVRHKKTGVVVWPVRFDLIPLFESVEGGYKNTSPKQTVFHFTSSSAFLQLVAEPDDYGEDEILEAWEYSEEMWQRLICLNQCTCICCGYSDGPWLGHVMAHANTVFGEVSLLFPHLPH